MIRIGLLSDTHGYLHPKVLNFLKDVDEIWHAGDIGDLETANKLERFKPLRAVYGNIDDYYVRTAHPEIQLFECEDIHVLMMHIGGYPGRYEKKALDLIRKLHPKLFISGHSHILKVIYDNQNDLLHINPGAAGKNGMHRVVTAVRFTIDGKEIKDLEIFELKRHVELL